MVWWSPGVVSHLPSRTRDPVKSKSKPPITGPEQTRSLPFRLVRQRSRSPPWSNPPPGRAYPIAPEAKDFETSSHDFDSLALGRDLRVFDCTWEETETGPTSPSRPSRFVKTTKLGVPQFSAFGAKASQPWCLGTPQDLSFGANEPSNGTTEPNFLRSVKATAKQNGQFQPVRCVEPNLTPLQTVHVV